MMKNTKIYKALKGVRGKKAVDIPSLEKLIVNFSHLVMEKWNYISEVEINPLLASGDALVALDARIILHESTVAPFSSIIRPAIRPYPSQYEQRFVTKVRFGTSNKNIMIPIELTNYSSPTMIRKEESV